ncbi:hypothetical protein N7493_002808 [Penicillium malachiteum]|uniref:AA1-like domain-containing protein n=1 Tax=Penicillium malachiteum TaxID=1324776 RepID=A0AAD6MZ43_9EURO|nr:hypothetical protein N7493_002808 [Penicillium malachiteum]
MKFIIASVLLAASSAFAVPHAKRDSYISITDLIGRDSITDGSIGFTLTDPNYPDDTPTDCYTFWVNGDGPDGSARCDNAEYYMKFPGWDDNFNLFTLEVQRVSGSIPENGSVVLDSSAAGSKWVCVDNPESGVNINCVYNATLLISV